MCKVWPFGSGQCFFRMHKLQHCHCTQDRPSINQRSWKTSGIRMERGLTNSPAYCRLWILPQVIQTLRRSHLFLVLVVCLLILVNHKSSYPHFCQTYPKANSIAEIICIHTCLSYSSVCSSLIAPYYKMQCVLNRQCCSTYVEQNIDCCIDCRL